MLNLKFGGFGPSNISEHFLKALDSGSEKSAFTTIPQEKFNEESLQQIFTSLLLTDATSSEPKGFYINTEENLKCYLDELQKLSEENKNILKEKITIVLPQKLHDSELAQQCDNKKTKAERVKYLIEKRYSFNIEVNDPQEIKDILSYLNPAEKKILATSNNSNLFVKLRPDFGASESEWDNLKKMTEIFISYIEAFSEPNESYVPKVLITTHSTGGVAASLPSRMRSVKNVSVITMMTSPFFWSRSNREDTVPRLFGIAGQPNDGGIMIEVSGLPQNPLFDLFANHNFPAAFISQKSEDILKEMEKCNLNAISISVQGDQVTNTSYICTAAPPESIKVELPEGVTEKELMNTLLQKILTAISKQGEISIRPGEEVIVKSQTTTSLVSQNQQSLSQ